MQVFFKFFSSSDDIEIQTKHIKKHKMATAVVDGKKSEFSKVRLFLMPMYICVLLKLDIQYIISRISGLAGYQILKLSGRISIIVGYSALLY